MFRCPQCGRIFTTLYGLKKHYYSLHGSLVCPVCGVKFKKSATMNWHLSTMPTVDQQHLVYSYLVSSKPTKLAREIASNVLRVST